MAEHDAGLYDPNGIIEPKPPQEERWYTRRFSANLKTGEQFDLKLTGTIKVKATSYTESTSKLNKELDIFIKRQLAGPITITKINLL